MAGVRIDEPPYGLETDGGEIVGFDPAIVHELARRWLGDENAVEFVPGALEQQVSRLAGGEIDLLAAAVTNERGLAGTIDFSQSYLGPPATDRDFKIGLPQHDAAFRELVNFTLQDMQKDGTYAELFDYWLGAGTPAYRPEVLPGNADYLPIAFQGTAATQQGTQAATSTNPLDSFDPTDSTVQRIRARANTLIAGVKYDFNPFGFLDDGGQVVGFDVDLIRALADMWGIDVEFVQVTSGDRIDRLAAGEVDLVAASITDTKPRDETIDFSQTYFVDGQSLLVRRVLRHQRHQ